MDMPSKNRNQDALDYHSQEPKGKIAVIPTKPVASQRDLALAYSPGVAVPCLAIAENIEDVYKYTAKGNLVGVISNGTAVLGLGDIGPDGANMLIFPDLTLGNIAYNLLMQIGNSDAIGPILLGMNKPVHVLQSGSSVREIYNMAAISIVDAQSHVSKS